MPQNDQLCRPVSPEDPEVIALAESIRREGLLEPLVITSDRFVLSGHRRLVACQLARLAKVPCRVVEYRSDDPKVLELLREHNRQRVKSLDEILREEVVSANPEEAHRFLQEYRRQATRVSTETITIEGHKHRAKITAAKEPFLRAIHAVLEDRKAFWPLTDRQIHYALLNEPPLIHASKPASVYGNTLKSYKSLCELLTRARLAGLIPFHAINDPTRPVKVWNFPRNVGGFLRRELNGFLKGYYRDLQQSQPNQVEIIGEKNTIDNIIRPIAMEYCIPMTIGRGYCSLPPRHAMAERFRQSGKHQLVLLALSDFDPEGEDIAHSFARSMRDDFGVEAIVPIKVALTSQQVVEMQLPPEMKAKETSSRYAKFTSRHGEEVFEMEAVPPGRLQGLLREAIDSVLDIDAYNAEIDAEKEDAARLDEVRRRALKVIGEVDSLVGPSGEEEE
jgi:hypothetical protein